MRSFPEPHSRMAHAFCRQRFYGEAFAVYPAVFGSRIAKDNGVAIDKLTGRARNKRRYQPLNLIELFAGRSCEIAEHALLAAYAIAVAVEPWTVARIAPPNGGSASRTSLRAIRERRVPGG